MMAIKYSSFLQIITLIHLAYGAEKLVVQELISTFTSASVQWSSNAVSQCQTTDLTEFSGQSVMGFFGLGDNTSSKTFSNIPPHWSLSIRFDLILYQSLDTNQDYIYVKINGNTDTYVKQNPGGGYKTCFPSNIYGDELVLYYYNITHSSSSIGVTIQSLTNEAISNEGFGFKNFYLYVDTCHDSCSTCNGPTAAQCLSCPNFSTQNGNTCTCNTGYSALNNQCILTCAAGYVKDSTGKFCVQDFCNTSTCSTCQSGLCTACKPGFYLLNGYCVSSCPSYSTLSGQQCKDLISLTSYGSYLLQTMFNPYFGESEVKGAGLTISGFSYNLQATRALTTVCNGKTLLGGAYLSSHNAQISRQFTGLQPHWSIAIGYTLYKIDSWDNEYVQLLVDGNVQVTTTRAMNDGAANLCGRVQYNDQIIQVAQNFTHTSTSLSLQIQTNLDSDAFDESYGIRELYVLVDYCSPNCITCDAKGCSKCQSNYYLYNYQCVSNCPASFASDSNKTCLPCDSTCLTCQTPQSSTSCITCKPNTYLNPNKSCQSNCPSQYWTDQGNWKCQNCNPQCYNCKDPGDQNSCTSCSGSSYLSSNQCVTTCPSNTFKLTQPNNNICQPCNSSCKTCDGPNNNNCLSCQAPNLFYQQSQKTCVPQCNSNQYQNTNNQTCSPCDTSCATCSGPNNNNCVTCTGNLFLYQNQCIPNCPSKYYNNTQNNQCSSCDSSCYTCSGAFSNNCKSCQLPLYFDPTSNKCVQTCNQNQYPDTSSDQCKQCDSSCQTCNGPSISNCLSCKQGLFLQNNQCISKCDDSYYVVPQTNICQKCDSSCQTCSGPSQSECVSCSSSLIFLNNSCLSECPHNYFTDQQQQMKECKKCHSYCKLGCKGPLEEDCDSIKYQYQIIFYILTGKSFIWVVSSLFGYFYDKKQSKIYTDTNFPPLSINSDKISNIFGQYQENNNNYQNEEKQQIQNPTDVGSQQNEKDQQAKQALTLQFQMKFDLDKMKRVGNRRPRQKFYKQSFYDKSEQIFECQLPYLNTNQPTFTKSISQFVPTQTNLINPSFLKDQKELNKRGVQVILPYIYKYKANQIFKFTILGNEWVSLFYFYDTEASRFIRATLIFLKYQAFFLSTEFVYESIQLLLIIALFASLAVKQIFKITQQLLVRKSFKFIAAIVFFFIAILGVHLYFWFLPELQSLKFLKDKTWSIYYGLLFTADFIIFQQLFSFIEYIFTIKYLNALYNGSKLSRVYKYLANEYFIQKIR